MNNSFALLTWSPVEEGVEFEEGQPQVLFWASVERGAVTLTARLLAHLPEEFWEYGLDVVAHVDNRVLAQCGPSWGIDFGSSAGPSFGLPDPNDEALNVLLSSIAYDYFEDCLFNAHTNIRGMIAETEDTLKHLRATRHKMQRVALTKDDKTFVLSLGMARTLLMSVSPERVKQKPFRIELVAPDMAAAYNEAGYEVGRIGFDPDKTKAGRHALYVVGPEENNNA